MTVFSLFVSIYEILSAKCYQMSLNVYQRCDGEWSNESQGGKKRASQVRQKRLILGMLYDKKSLRL